MTEATCPSPSGLSLTEFLLHVGSLGEGEPLALFAHLAGQVQSLHSQGRTHRMIGPDTIRIDDFRLPCLSEPPEVRRFGGRYADPNHCPPELLEVDEIELPADCQVAAARLQGAGIKIDPRRVDVYQLAALLVRLLGNTSVSCYLSSPKAAAAIPRDLRSAVDRALGYCAASRMESVEELLGELAGEHSRTGGETPPAGLRSTAALALKDAPSLPFQQLDRYRLLSPIGQGGMGDVYLARDDSLGRDVAVKVLAPQLSRDTSFVRRFRKEAAAAAQVRHPNVVQVYLIGEEQGQHFFVMELIDGETLANRLTRLHRLPQTDVLNLLEQCLAGLAAAHACGLVHRDVKPANILLERGSGRAVLVDFGLAHRAGDDTRLTADGTIMGTVDYIAPEQAVGAKVDARADIYALGVIAYQALSGRLPHEADSPTGVLYQHVHEKPLPLEEVAPDVAQPLSCIVARMMAKQPHERYQSCEELARDLRAFGETGLPAADPLATAIDGKTSHQTSAAWFGVRSDRRRLRRILLGLGMVGAAICAAVIAGRPNVSAPTAPGLATSDSGAAASDSVSEANLIDAPPGTWVSLVEHFRPERDIVQGDWSIESDGICVVFGQASRIMLPVLAGGEDYSLEVEFTRNSGDGSVVVLLPVGSGSCGLTLHGWEGIDGLEVIDSRRANDNSTTRYSIFENQQRYRLRVDVGRVGEEASIEVSLDNEPYLQWKGNATALATYFHWALPNAGRPGLGAWGTEVIFHSIRFHRGPLAGSLAAGNLSKTESAP